MVADRVPGMVPGPVQALPVSTHSPCTVRVTGEKTEAQHIGGPGFSDPPDPRLSALPPGPLRNLGNLVIWRCMTGPLFLHL